MLGVRGAPRLRAVEPLQRRAATRARHERREEQDSVLLRPRARAEGQRERNPGEHAQCSTKDGVERADATGQGWPLVHSREAAPPNASITGPAKPIQPARASHVGGPRRCTVSGLLTLVSTPIRAPEARIAEDPTTSP